MPSDAPSESSSVARGTWRRSPAFVSGLHVTPELVIATLAGALAAQPEALRSSTVSA